METIVRTLALGSLALTSLFSASAEAYPWNVRHGYPNCTSCHLSPGGGGVLNPYGRELSREIQSTKGGENEPRFLYGAVNPPEWIDAGGDMRYLQLVQDSPAAVEGRGFWMQWDLEAGVHLGERVTLVGTAGWKGNADSVRNDSAVISRRHYAMFAVTDRFGARAGRFFPVYGLMQAEHEDATRSPIGFDENMESYNLELSDQNESGSLFVSPIFGRLRGDRRADEKGVAVSKFFFVGGDSRIGVSALYGRGYRASYERRYLFGPNAVLNFSKKLFWTGEVDLERRKTLGADAHVTGIYQLQKLTYEPIQGLLVSARQDLQRRRAGDGRTGYWTLGPMIDWYPRPHLDLQVVLSRAFLSEGAPGLWTYTGMLHFYL